MGKHKELTQEEMETIEQAALLSANNLGATKDMFHPDYGWILKDGKITEIGFKFMEDLQEKK